MKHTVLYSAKIDVAHMSSNTEGFIKNNIIIINQIKSFLYFLYYSNIV